MMNFTVGPSTTKNLKPRLIKRFSSNPVHNIRLSIWGSFLFPLFCSILRKDNLRNHMATEQPSWHQPEEEALDRGARSRETLAQARKDALLKRIAPQEETDVLRFGETFSPENEAKAILEAPSNERRARLKQFKEKLAYQQEGIAKMQEEIIALIRRNPDISREDLMKEIGGKGKYLGLEEEQHAIASELASLYTTKHLDIENFREKHPDNSEMFAAITGVRPVGNIEVIAG